MWEIEHIKLNVIRRIYIIAGRGSYYDAEYWKQYTGGLTVIFETQVGRSFWKTMTLWIEPEIKLFGDEMLAAGNIRPCDDPYDAWASDFTSSAAVQTN